MEKSLDNLYQRLQVGLNADCSIASQIADQLRWLIVTGEIKVGEKLPPVRNGAGLPDQRIIRDLTSFSNSGKIIPFEAMISFPER